MDLLQIVILLFVVCLAVLIVDKVRSASRRRKVIHIEFPEAWLVYLKNNVPLYDRLPNSLQKELQQHIKIFIDEKEFEPCGELEELDDEMRVTIAANACILLLNKKTPYYSKLRSVLVYPGAYKASGGDGVFFGEEARSGESWDTGSVVLSWDGVKRSCGDPKDGQNLVLHEFAHQLDQRDGVADGAPELESAGAYRAWARVFGKHYAELREKVEHGKNTVLDEYGAENAAEFFAVATETFYERPEMLEREKPELYAQLKSFYKVDPARWKKK